MERRTRRRSSSSKDLAASPSRPARIGIAGYPERHPTIPGTALLDALDRKAEHADDVVTQMCFDPEHLRAWLARMRDRGIRLPVLLGVPGAVKRRKLVEMSMKIGVGSSLRYLNKNSGTVTTMLRREHIRRTRCSTASPPRSSRPFPHSAAYTSSLSTNSTRRCAGSKA